MGGNNGSRPQEPEQHATAPTVLLAAETDEPVMEKAVRTHLVAEEESLALQQKSAAAAPAIYEVLWYDPAYPSPNHVAFQEDFAKALSGVPVLFENSIDGAVKRLNKFSVRSRYILVASGKGRKKLVLQAQKNPMLAKTYVISPEDDKLVERWGKDLIKLSVVSDTDRVIEELRKLIKVYEGTDAFCYSTSCTVLDYKILPIRSLMSEQGFVALKNETDKTEEQRGFRHRYQNFVAEVRAGVAQGAKAAKTPLWSLLRDQDQKRCAEDFHKLLRISLYLDDCPYVLSGIGMERLQEIVVGSFSPVKGNSPKGNRGLLLDLIESIHVELEKNHTLMLDELSPLRGFHSELLQEVVSCARKQYGSISKWGTLHRLKMLMLDLDVCAKLFLLFCFRSDENFGQQARDFAQAAMASDPRVSMISDQWTSWGSGEVPESIALSGEELNQALEKVRISHVVVIHSSGQLKGLGKLLQESCADLYRLYEYGSCAEFVSDLATQNKLRFCFVYVIFEPGTSSDEYNKLWDICVVKSVTPLFVLYAPEPKTVRFSKELAKSGTVVYCYTHRQILDYITGLETNLNRDLQQYSKYYDNFKVTLGNFVPESEESRLSSETGPDAGSGWELLTSVNKAVLTQLVEELHMGVSLVGSLHYYIFSDMRQQKKQDVYWKNYGQLFGVTDKRTLIPDVNFAKTCIRAYTLDTDPAFYRMLNRAFRGGKPELIARYRVFYTHLYGVIKRGLLKKYVGKVYRGTYFNPKLLGTLRPGMVVFSACFTSTSKADGVAREYAAKTKDKNVLLELELSKDANCNVDIDGEDCSRCPAEKEVLLFPFSAFEIVSVTKEANFTAIYLRETVLKSDSAAIKSIDFSA